jgi:hypothetical protein
VRYLELLLVPTTVIKEEELVEPILTKRFQIEIMTKDGTFGLNYGSLTAFTILKLSV